MIARPVLMFQGNAAAAIAFYEETIPGTRIVRVEQKEPAGPGLEPTKLVTLWLAGLEVMVFDSPVKHDFDFTPAFSLFIDCTALEEIERLASRLAEGGRVLMPLGEYGFSRRFAWVEDRHHVSWQINLP